MDSTMDNEPVLPLCDRCAKETDAYEECPNCGGTYCQRCWEYHVVACPVDEEPTP